MNEEQIERARKVSIRDILGLKTNRRVSVKCVFHRDNTPSLSINPDGGYYCFGCGKRGRNAIDFVIHLGHDFKSAVNELNNY